MSTKRYMNSGEDSLGIYLRDVRKTRILTQTEEVELAKRAQDGDDTALDELVRNNLRFVISVAKEYQNQGLPLTDLISEGNCGLILAAKKFDYTKGYKFISYAVWWIKQCIMSSLNDNSRTVRIPANVVNKLYKSNREIAKFEKQFHRQPTKEEVERVEIPKCISLNITINEDGDEYMNVIEDKNADRPDEDKKMALLIKKEISNVLGTISPRERDIIESYYGINGTPMTLEMIGAEYDLTKERIRQIKDKAIRKLRHHIEPLRDLIYD